jgi:hypothetical protein
MSKTEAGVGRFAVAVIAMTGCTADLPPDGMPPMSIACETARSYLSRCLDASENDRILRGLNEDHRRKSISDSDFTQMYCAVCQAPWEAFVTSCPGESRCEKTFAVPHKRNATSSADRRANEAADYNYNKSQHYRISLPLHIEIEF